jgi:hypothetical protein
VIWLGSKKSVRPLCASDGLPCDGLIVAGSPFCSVSTFGVLGDDDLYVCPRLRTGAKTRSG